MKFHRYWTTNNSLALERNFWSTKFRHKGIRVPKFGKFLHVETGILEILPVESWILALESGVQM